MSRAWWAAALAALPLLAEGQEPDIRPLKPLLPIERGSALGPLALALVLAALAGAGVWLWLRRRRARALEVPLSPGAEALAALDRLAHLDLAGDERRRELVFALSAALRRYIEARFGLNATDLTREEIVAGLGSLAELPAAEAVRLRRLLGDTDEVKFAARVPAADEVRGALAEARRFVAGTAPDPAAPAPPREHAA